MDELKNAPAQAAGQDAPELGTPVMVRKIGRTTYTVRLHFSETSRETMADKIRRMMKNELLNR